ncbi:integrase, catalytic region, zinc finger, CCHC-type containing protein [Tanacetum coccineum]
MAEIGCSRARIGSSKSSQSLSIAHKWAVIDIHFVRDIVKAGHVRVLHVPCRFRYADIFTKGLPSALFEDFRSSLSIRPPPAQTAGAFVSDIGMRRDVIKILLERLVRSTTLNESQALVETDMDPQTMYQFIMSRSLNQDHAGSFSSLYCSVPGQMEFRGKKHGRMMLDSIDNGLLVYLTVEENGQTGPMKYSELIEAQQIQDDCDVQATSRSSTRCGETLYEYYWRFSQLINDIKFATDVKLAKSLYTTNYDQLYAYLSQHEQQANEVRITLERYPDPLALVANSPTLFNPSQSPQHSGEDLIECINKAMAFLFAVASRFPPLNNQLRTSSNPRNQATIQDGRVTVQQVQERQNKSCAGTGNRGIATTSKGNYAAGQPRVVKCYNCQGEGHMARQYCDDLSSAKAVLMANLSSCDLEVLSEVRISQKSQENSQNRASTDTRIRKVQKPEAKPGKSSLSQIQLIYGQ